MNIKCTVIERCNLSQQLLSCKFNIQFVTILKIFTICNYWLFTRVKGSCRTHLSSTIGKHMHKDNLFFQLLNSSFKQEALLPYLQIASFCILLLQWFSSIDRHYLQLLLLWLSINTKVAFFTKQIKTLIQQSSKHTQNCIFLFLNYWEPHIVIYG